MDIDRVEAALSGVRRVVADVVDDMKKAGEKIPEPIACKNYSGNLISPAYLGLELNEKPIWKIIILIFKGKYHTFRINVKFNMNAKHNELRLL